MVIFSLVIVSVFLCVQTIAETADNNCRAPDQQQGECKLITECSSLYNMLLNESRSANATKYLKKSHCGFSGKYPKVCCPKNDPRFENNHVVKDNVLLNNEICGYFKDYIIAGPEAQLGQFPWNALLKYETGDGQNDFYCGGSLISEQYILTAAHCIKGADLPKNATLVSVRLGEHDTDTDPDCVAIRGQVFTDCSEPISDVSIEQTTVHEDYNPNDPNQYHDIALIRLKHKISFNDFIRPLCLPSSAEELKANYTDQKLPVAGWGINKNKINSTAKMRSDVSGIEMSNCNSIFNPIGIKLGQTQMCTGRQNTESDSCFYDSGGSLLGRSRVNWRYYAAGVMSFQHLSCNMENHVTVYTKVDQYVDWIVGQLKQ